MKAWEKIEKLEMSVMQDSTDNAAALYDTLGEMPFTARALGLACRYRGLEMTRLLVERGAAFAFDMEKLKPVLIHARYFWLDLYGDENYSLGLLSTVARRETYELNNIGKMHCGVSLVSSSERLQTLDFFLKNAKKIGFKADEFLFYAYLANEREMIDFLKSKGVRASKRLLKIITEGANNDDWLNYCFLTGKLTDGEFLREMGAIAEECGGKKLHFTEKFWEYNSSRFEKPELFKFLLEHFNQTKMNKTKLMKNIIERDDVECLELCTENGWLKLPKKRDEMIAFAVDNEKAECSAYLLDFKNRTADLSAERAKAEKKLERELNADPNSVSELKKIWKYKKREDGSIIITGYKGNRTEITVPDKIGKSPVTAIGEYAFSPNAPRVTEEQALTRCRITKITLPETVVTIGEDAFGGSGACAVKGLFNAFSDLAEINLPKSLEFFASREAAEKAPKIFRNCKKLTVKIPRSPYARMYCKRLNVAFEFYGGNYDFK